MSLEEGFVYLDAREVRTKFAKTIKSYFYPVGEEPLTCLVDWIAELRAEHGWRPEDPLFPKTRIAQREMHLFGEAGIMSEHWSNADPVRRIFKEAFARAKLTYYQPHSFRNTLARIGEQRCRTPEEFKAWSQNMGHEHVMTTFNSYGHVDDHRQAEIIKGLGTQHTSEDKVDDLIDRLARAVKKRG